MGLLTDRAVIMKNDNSFTCYFGEHMFDFAKVPEDKIDAKECRFAVYVPAPDYDQPDMHFIKEIVHLKDGTSVPNFRMEYDRERPFWITKKGFRNHEQHKEWELKSKLQEFRSNERQMGRKVANALGMPWIKDLRGCLNEPYVYGIDITSTACVKKEYKDKWKKNTGFSIAELDIESDVIDGTERPTMVTLFMPPAYGQEARCTTFITQQFADKVPGFLKKFEEATQLILNDYIDGYRKKPKKYNVAQYPITYHSEIVNDDMHMWLKVFALAHEWKPDLLSIWNMEYEMGKMEESCGRYSVDPKDFLSDPNVPEAYRYYKYVQGKAQKVTASGKVMPIKPAGRWHYVEIPASFYIIDQMCTYKQTRMGQQEETSYSLDAIMKKEIGMTKLKFDMADHIPSGGLDWHIYMQKNHPVEYAVYNRFDCIGPAFIDEKIKDLSFVLPAMAGTSDFKKFPSQPRRTCDNLHWYLLELEEPRVMGCTSKEMVDDYDSETLSRDGWIVTLPAETITEEGLCVLQELPDAPSRIFGHVGD